MKSRILMFAFLATLTGCGGPQEVEVDLSDVQGRLGLLDVAGLLTFVNDAGAVDVDLLNVECGLRADSAANIVRHRDGPDGVAGTCDDDPFGSLPELDGVHMVGDWTLDQLYICAARNGYLFSYEAGLIVFLNDHLRTDRALLERSCLVDPDAARNLILHRDGPDGIPGSRDDDPFDHIQEVDNVPRVGLATLERAYACASELGYMD